MSSMVTTALAAALAVAAPAEATAPTVQVDNDLSQLPTDEVTEDLGRWLLEDQTKVLQEGGVEVSDTSPKTIRVVVRMYGENNLNYEATVTLVEEGQAEPRAERVLQCEACSETELVAKVVGEVARVSGLVVYAANQEPASEDEDPSTSDADPTPAAGSDEDPKLKPIGPVGYTGIGLGVAGLAAAVVGAVYVARGDRVSGADSTMFDRSEDNPSFGTPMLGVGIGVLVVGAIMVGVDVGRRAKQRRGQDTKRVSLDARPGYAGLSLRGRF